MLGLLPSLMGRPLGLLFCSVLILLSQCAVAKKSSKGSCTTCRQITDNFRKGFDRTAKQNFGGGNTAWEERALSKYETSEIRLVEILESLCDSSSFECNHMVEEYEEHFETWWFKKKTKNPDLYKWFCIETINVCCPKGTFGPDCNSCIGGAERPCHGNGACDGDETRGGNGKCSCDHGYKGEFCLDCIDGYFNEVRNDTFSLCIECHASCKTCYGATNQKCDECKTGWEDDDHEACVDINECVANTSPCRPGQTCINTVGSYTCRRNTVTCGRGYHLSEDGTRCEDVDECRGGDPCVGHGCVNLLGSYRCECRPGFIFNSITKLCEDINECRHYPGRLCAHKCENTEGSYKCSCTQGFKLAYDGRNCDDVNECEANPCSQECSNVYGSYQCYCRRGYQLSDIDGISCEDIDECALPTGGHVCSYRCSNAPGSFYCTCPPTGYTLAQNGRTCHDIDECAAGSHTCSVTESCFNVQGGFRCLSFECPPMFHRSTEGPSNDATVNVRCIKYCPPGDISCAQDPVHLISQTVLSLPTFREFSRPEEIVFLRTMAQANPTSSTGTSDVIFDIIAADDQNSFDVVKRLDHDMIIGVVRQVKPITGPKNIVLKVAMSYRKSSNISHRNIVIVNIFISEFWF
ncbi:fibulin-1-like isoform 1-T1 [Aplochiton taeniatus]